MKNEEHLLSGGFRTCGCQAGPQTDSGFTWSICWRPAPIASMQRCMHETTTMASPRPENWRSQRTYKPKLNVPVPVNCAGV